MRKKEPLHVYCHTPIQFLCKCNNATMQVPRPLHVRWHCQPSAIKEQRQTVLAIVHKSYTHTWSHLRAPTPVRPNSCSSSSKDSKHVNADRESTVPYPPLQLEKRSTKRRRGCSL